MCRAKLGPHFGERLASRLLASPQCALQEALKNTAQQWACFPTSHNPLIPPTHPTYSPLLTPYFPPLLLRTLAASEAQLSSVLRPLSFREFSHCFQSSTSTTSGDACRTTCAMARLLVLLCHESPRRHLPHRRGLLRLQLNESESLHEGAGPQQTTRAPAQ